MKKLSLETLLNSDNIAEELDDQDLIHIGQKVCNLFDDDQASRTEWLEVARRSVELAQMKAMPKDTPWPNAANVKMPIVSRAAIQFASNAVSETIRKNKLADATVIGLDMDGRKARRAQRIAMHLNYQTLQKDTKWRDTFERTIQLLGVVGLTFKKVYYDPIKQDICTELCMYDEIVVHNDIASLEDARRISHLQHVHTNTLIERSRVGYYIELSDDELHLESDDHDQSMHEIIEQHGFLDLDGDGYEEPYIITVHRETMKVLRIYPRFEAQDIRYNSKDQIATILPQHYFVDYHCIPSMDGSYHSIGFGALLHTINETVNTGINQLIDAGTLANTPPGFVTRALNIKGGEIKLRPGYFQKLDTHDPDVRKSIFQMQIKDPSTTLFQLMGVLDDAAKELSTTTDIMTGNQLAQNAPATSVLTLVERGMKVYNAIQKRIFRALTKELRIIHRLNKQYGDPQEYMTILDDPEANWEEDFNDDKIDVKPVADPDMSSDAQRLAQAQLLFQLLREPEVDKYEIMRRYLEAANISNIQAVLPPPDPQAVNDPAIVQMQQEIQLQQQKLALEEKKLQLEAQKLQMQAAKTSTDIQDKKVKTAIQAQGVSVEREKIAADAFAAQQKLQADLLKETIKQQTAVEIARSKNTSKE